MSSGTLAASAGRALLPLGAFLALVALADFADWGEGPTRAATLALSAAALAWLWRNAPAPAPPGSRVWLALALAISFARTAPELGATSRSRSPNDIGWTTVRAVEAQAQGRSPYASLVDPQRDLPRHDPGLGWFMGYKYGPLVPRFYSPFLAVLGAPRGLYAGNALLLVAATLLAALLAARAGGVAAALGASAAVLWPSFARFELFWQGVNDLLPTALALGALLAASWGARARTPGPRVALALASGAALGLSAAAKPLPGALLLLLLPGTVRPLPFAAGLALGLLPYLPPLLAAPRELVANLVIFNVLRPGDSTGAGWALPHAFRWAPPLVAAAASLAAAIAYHRSPRRPRDLVLATALVATCFLAGGKLIHRNYLLWWLPLAAAALGASCWRSADAPGTRS